MEFGLNTCSPFDDGYSDSEHREAKEYTEHYSNANNQQQPWKQKSASRGHGRASVNTAVLWSPTIYTL